MVWYKPTTWKKGTISPEPAATSTTTETHKPARTATSAIDQEIDLGLDNEPAALMKLVRPQGPVTEEDVIKALKAAIGPLKTGASFDNAVINLAKKGNQYTLVTHTTFSRDDLEKIGLKKPVGDTPGDYTRTTSSDKRTFFFAFDAKVLEDAVYENTSHASKVGSGAPIQPASNNPDDIKAVLKSKSIPFTQLMSDLANDRYLITSGAVFGKKMTELSLVEGQDYTVESPEEIAPMKKFSVNATALHEKLGINLPEKGSVELA